MEQREGVLSGFARTEIFGVPIGAAATGLLIAGAWDGIAGLVQASIVGARIPSWAIPAIGSFVTTRWAGRLVGDVAAQTAGLILDSDAIQQFFNVRGLVSGLFGRVAAAPTAGLGGIGQREEITLPPELLGSVLGQEEYEAAKRGMY